MDARPSDQVRRFFSDLEQRGHEPLLARASGTLRFDLRHGRSVDCWYVTINKGDLEVARSERDADVVLQMDRSVFARMTEGKVNTMAAVLRGDVEVAGDLTLAMAFQRVLPGPPDAVGPKRRSLPGRNPDG
jgi:putative sterol carrier protein